MSCNYTATTFLHPHARGSEIELWLCTRCRAVAPRFSLRHQHKQDVARASAWDSLWGGQRFCKRCACCCGSADAVEKNLRKNLRSLSPRTMHVVCMNPCSLSGDVQDTLMVAHGHTGACKLATFHQKSAQNCYSAHTMRPPLGTRCLAPIVVSHDRNKSFPWQLFDGFCGCAMNPETSINFGNPLCWTFQAQMIRQQRDARLQHCVSGRVQRNAPYQGRMGRARVM